VKPSATNHDTYLPEVEAIGAGKSEPSNELHELGVGRRLGSNDRGVQHVDAKGLVLCQVATIERSNLEYRIEGHVNEEQTILVSDWPGYHEKLQSAEQTIGCRLQALPKSSDPAKLSARGATRR